MRGVGLVGLRGSFAEVGAWFVSCLLLGLIHVLNAFFGQGFGATVVQYPALVLALVALVPLLRSEPAPSGTGSTTRSPRPAQPA